jgi:putative iron-only hydrogenase system regulator
LKGIEEMDTRIALIGIIVDNIDSTEKLNTILHEYGQYIIGRMGIPYREKKVSIISVVIDATNDVISSLSGKLGMIEGISVKTVYSKTDQVKLDSGGV